MSFQILETVEREITSWRHAVATHAADAGFANARDAFRAWHPGNRNRSRKGATPRAARLSPRRPRLS
jgi:hypothetical protein